MILVKSRDLVLATAYESVDACKTDLQAGNWVSGAENGNPNGPTFFIPPSEVIAIWETV